MKRNESSGSSAFFLRERQRCRVRMHMRACIPNHRLLGRGLAFIITLGPAWWAGVIWYHDPHSRQSLAGLKAALGS